MSSATRSFAFCSISRLAAAGIVGVLNSQGRQLPAQYEPFSNHGQPTGSAAHVHAVHWSQLCHKALLIRLLQHFRHVPDVFRQRLHGITVHFLVRLCVVLLAAHPIARARSSVTPATQRQDQWCPFGIDYAAYLEARLRQG